jgi:hypothetical protein
VTIPGVSYFVVVGGAFGTLAALIAALITGSELQHHRLSKGRILLETGRTALLVFVVFVIVSLVTGLVLVNLFTIPLPG